MKKVTALILSILMILTSWLYYPGIAAKALTAADFTISQNGLDFIIALEGGFRSTCYYDGKQSSIGYGTNCGTTPHASGLHSITKEEASAAMKNKISVNFIPNVRRQTAGIQMNQNQFDALVSFTYNTGGGTKMISNSPLVAFLRGEISESEARTRYANYIVTDSSTGQVSNGLINRRKAEADLFFSGTPTQSVSTHTVDPSYPTNFSATAISKKDVFFSDHTDAGDHWVAEGDPCTIHEVYTDGCCRVTYPTKSGSCTYYCKIDNFAFSIKPSYWLDVNCEVDGIEYSNCNGYGTFDVYINGSCVGSSVNDYYIQHTEGTSYSINNVYPASGYRYLGISNASGTIDNPKKVVLKFESVRKSQSFSFPNTVYSLNISAGGDEYYCSFTPTMSREHVIYSTNTDGRDPKVYLYDSNGTLLASNDNKSSSDKNFRLAYNLNAGSKYYYLIEFTSSAETGSINVRLGYTYDIEYDANGGSGAPSSFKIGHYEPFCVSSTTPTRNGYSFCGWAGSPDSTSGQVFPGETRWIAADTDITTLTFYAVWKQIKVSSIALSPSTLYMDLDTTQAIAPSISPDNAANKNVTWSSSDTNVATVSSTGKISAKNLGTTTITCTAADGSGVKSTMNVTVRGTSIFGDAEPDGVIDFKDISALNSYRLGFVTFNDEQLFKADVNGDGIVDIKDINSINSFRNGMIGEFPVESMFKSINVKTLPSKTVYSVGESFSDSGLVISTTYSNGTTHTMSSGFTTSGFNSSWGGRKQIAVSYAGKTTTFYVYVALAAPGYLTANASSDSVSLTWASVPNASKYTVLRSTSATGTYTTIASGISATSYTDTDVTSGTTYYYKVKAHNAYSQCDGKLSNYASTTVPTLVFSALSPESVYLALGSNLAADMGNNASGSSNATLVVKKDGEVIETSTASGNSATCDFDSVAPGTYSLEVSKTNYVTRTYELVVMPDGTYTLDGEANGKAEIYLRGDVNMSGSVNTTDALWVQQYYAGKRSLSDYALLLADANQSNTVNTTDALWIKQQYAGIRDSAFNRV